MRTLTSNVRQIVVIPRAVAACRRCCAKPRTIRARTAANAAFAAMANTHTDGTRDSNDRTVQTVAAVSRSVDWPSPPQRWPTASSRALVCDNVADSIHDVRRRPQSAEPSVTAEARDVRGSTAFRDQLTAVIGRRTDGRADTTKIIFLALRRFLKPVARPRTTRPFRLSKIYSPKLR